MATAPAVIIGTAGHIDHGKTALVQALTGKNTDRLPEEQERGISIDIDFAPLEFADGTVVGLVDVPGHERFVRNMVAGAAGIDAALIAIDVNEGVMPQTREHLAILELLGVHQAVIALTKADLADEEWLALAPEMIAESLRGTPFADARRIVTSVRTGLGVEDLRCSLRDLASASRRRQVGGSYRLPIDKVFSIPGFGTVVSGTSWRGQVQVGDVLDCLPGRDSVRVRGIQIHGRPSTSARAGQRTAINLTGVDDIALERGFVLASPGSLRETTLIDVRLSLLPTAARPLAHRDRIHFHLGTAALIGRVLLLEAEELAPGLAAFAQVELERTLVCEVGDQFVIRSYSPVTTIGGGAVLDSDPGRLHRRRRDAILHALAVREQGTPLQRLLVAARQQPLTVPAVAAQLGCTPAQAQAELARAVAAGELLQLPEAVHPVAVVEETLTAMVADLTAEHHRQRLRLTLPRSAVLRQVGHRYGRRDRDWLLAAGEQRGLWQLDAAGIRLREWVVVLTAAEQQRLDAVLRQLLTTGLGTADMELLTGGESDDKQLHALLQYARETGRVVEVAPGVLLHRDVYQQAVDTVRDLFQVSGPFTAATVRDVLHTSRKQVIQLLEYLDKAGVTRRDGDVRVVTNF